eukprot:g4828.t1
MVDYYSEASSSSGGKFWSVMLKQGDTQTTVRFGKIGAKGSAQVKDHGTPEKALKFVQSMIRKKEKKGYIKKSSSSSSSSTSSAPSVPTKKAPAKKTKTKRKREDDTSVDQGPYRFLMTGTLSVGRKEMTQEIERAFGAGSVVSGITRATHLLCADSDGHGTSKHTQAVKRGIPVVSEEFLR